MSVLDFRNLSQDEKDIIKELFDDLKNVSVKKYFSNNFDNITHVEYTDEMMLIRLNIENRNETLNSGVMLKQSDFEDINVFKNLIEYLKSVNTSSAYSINFNILDDANKDRIKENSKYTLEKIKNNNKINIILDKIDKNEIQNIIFDTTRINFTFLKNDVVGDTTFNVQDYDNGVFINLINTLLVIYKDSLTNKSGGNRKDYYIDKDNKKYNRKITKNGKKQYVRYNNKIIELKMYKELIKKEKKVINDKQKQVKKTSMKKK